MNVKAEKLMNELRNKYKNDSEALEIIERNVADIEYLERKEKDINYKGQTAYQHTKALEDFLHDWY